MRSEYIAEEDYVIATRQVLRSAGDIVYHRRGTSGQVAHAIIREAYFTSTQQSLRSSETIRRCRPQFLYYYSSAIKYACNRLKQRSLALRCRIINPDHTSRSFEIRLPPLPTQRKIAAILSAYDDLIEVNTRRIALLEEMARGLYREWFVRFRFPGHEGVRMVESAVGLVPEGWEVVKHWTTL